ncbi:MAG: NADH-quinone oxidoreductase subunit L [bacterium]
MEQIYLTIALAPLAGSVIAGLLRNQVGRTGSHIVTILGVAVSTVLSAYVLKGFAFDGAEPFNQNLYTWMDVGSIHFAIGFLIDPLTAVMMTVVTSVSLMVHIYTIGYMREDPGYQRFFSYISLFTFSMLMLVMANNFLQLFFGWEAVGLVSYLLIGFWFKRETAIFANMKAFLVNRVGDFGFLLGIAAVLMYFGTLDYAQVFTKVGDVDGQTISLLAGHEWSVITVICILLFVGAMGKSAQVPLHVWLPDSMEGPTPISALIHAATMVTAGIFMVARLSPIFEFSETALSFILIIGAITALFMGLIGIVQNDIKRVIAYSTLSQLGYMTVALGASAYSAAIFHLMTHAFFKALLFLGAGSVIIAMHHEQDMRKMGGLRKYMPITFITAWVGTLALTGMPGTSGFFSKDIIIEAVQEVMHEGHRFGAGFAWFAVVAGVLITALYSFRLVYLTFHGSCRADAKTESHLKETPLVVTVPLILLAIPSLIIGWLTVEPMLFGGFLSSSIMVLPEHDVIAKIGEEFHGAGEFVIHGILQLPFILALAGFAIATYIYLFNQAIAARIAKAMGPVYRLLQNKYYFDELYQLIFASGAQLIGKTLWKQGDVNVIDEGFVNGSAKLIDWFSAVISRFQTGYLYHYAFAMVIGVVGLLWFFV